MKPTTLNDAIDRIRELETQLEHRSRCLMQFLAFVQGRIVDGNMTTEERHILRAGHDIALRRAADGDPWGGDEVLGELVDEAMAAETH